MTTSAMVTVRVLRCGDFLVIEVEPGKPTAVMTGYYIGDSARPPEAL